MTNPTRERRPSVGAPISDLQGPVGPGFSRPKHKRTFTGFGPQDIKKVEASIPEPQREAYVLPPHLQRPLLGTGEWAVAILFLCIEFSSENVELILCLGRIVGASLYDYCPCSPIFFH